MRVVMVRALPILYTEILYLNWHLIVSKFLGNSGFFLCVSHAGIRTRRVNNVFEEVSLLYIHKFDLPCEMGWIIKSS